MIITNFDALKFIDVTQEILKVLGNPKWWSSFNPCKIKIHLSIINLNVINLIPTNSSASSSSFLWN